MQHGPDELRTKYVLRTHVSRSACRLKLLCWQQLAEHVRMLDRQKCSYFRSLSLMAVRTLTDNPYAICLVSSVGFPWFFATDYICFRSVFLPSLCFFDNIPSAVSLLATPFDKTIPSANILVITSFLLICHSVCAKCRAKSH